MEINLAKDVRAKATHFVRVRKDYSAYRVIVEFISDMPDESRLIKEYYVWLTDIFVEDFLRISRSAEENDYKNVALKLVKQRFDVKKDIPTENGLDASNERGVIRIVDAVNYVHPVEKD